MKALMSICLLAMILIASACSEPAKGVTQPPRTVTNDSWSDSAIAVDPQDPNANIVIRGVTVDASGAPLAGAVVSVDSRMAPPEAGHASSDAILNIGTLTSDASGHFVITSTPRGYYQLGAEADGASHVSGHATVDLRLGAREVDVTIRLLPAQ